MDNIAHTLIGVTIANAGLKQRFGKGTTWALAIASNITDIDVFWGLVHEGDSFLYRRMLTHSIIGLPVLSLLGGFLFSRIFKNLSFKISIGLFILGTGLHVFFDLLNSFGVVMLYPLNLRRFDLSWVFIIDLAIWSLLLLPLILMAFKSFQPRLLLVSRIGVIGLAAYVSLCGLSRWRAEVLLSKWMQSQTVEASLSYIFPEALGAHRFRGVVRLENEYHTFLIVTPSGKLEKKSIIPTDESHADVKKIKESKEAKNLEWFFKAPVWKKGSEQGIWEVSDLQFRSEVIGRNAPFTYKFELIGDRVYYRG